MKKEYTILQMRDETWICKEDLMGPQRFRRMTIPTRLGPDSLAASDAVHELLKGRGNVKVTVDEQDGHVEVSVGEQSVEGRIALLD